jgi:hypothetical protein
VGQIVRLAGLLHASEPRGGPWERPIALSTMERAIALEPYFVAHAKAARFELDVDPAVQRARRAVEWIRGRPSMGGARPFTRSELHKVIAKNRPVTEIDPLLLLLIRHGAIKEVEAPTQTGGRPRGATFEVRPNLSEVSDGE